VPKRLIRYVQRFDYFFMTKTRPSIRTAQQYLRGLLQSDRRNMERMEQVVPSSNEQALQHFISNSPWDAEAVMRQVARGADALLGGHEDTLLIIDESGIPKKGKHSAGVARQWCGQLGKVENSQVGVYGAMAHGDKVALTDARLFVPREWTNDPERCRRAGIPETVWRNPQTKFDLALDIVVRAAEEGLRFQWVSADGAYGENAFLLPLDTAGLLFMVDVHCDHRMWFATPPAKGGEGRQRVDDWLSEQPDSAWKEVTTREGTRGTIRYEVLHARVWVYAGSKEPPRQWHLLVRREIDNPRKVKYTLSNAPADMPLDHLAYIQGQRYWVERALQDAKRHSGLGDYQVRGWLGWHHHMAVVLMAMLFVLEERVHHGATVPMLSTADVEKLLKHYLPRRDATEQELFRLLQQSHVRRTRATDAHRKRSTRI
jgi:SRSO17 transposase